MLLSFNGVIICICNTSLASFPERDYDNFLNKISSIVGPAARASCPERGYDHFLDELSLTVSSIGGDPFDLESIFGPMFALVVESMVLHEGI